MVEQVKAFKSEDGTLFTDQLEALKHDTEDRLRDCVGQACMVEIMGKVLGVHAILTPLVQFLESRVGDKG